MTVPAPPAHVKVTVTFALFHPAALGAGFDVAVIVSAEPRVTFKFEVAMLPATSAACTTMAFDPVARARMQEKFAPFRTAAMPLQVTFDMPDSASAAVPVIVSCGLVTVAAADGAPIVRMGLLLSIFSVAEAVAVLPTASVAVREMT